MHIVFLSPHSDPQANLGEPDSGGQCVYESELAQSLSEIEGLKVTTFCRQTGQRPDHSVINDNYQIHRIHCGEPGFIPKEDIEKVLPEFTSGVVQKLGDKKPDIFHGHYWDGGKAMLHLKTKPEYQNIPAVWTPHSLGVLKRKKFPGLLNEQFYNFIPRITWENYTVFSSDKIIVSSEKEKNAIIEEYLLENERITIVPPGVNIDQFVSIDKAVARKRFNLPMEAKILLCLGRITRFKGYHHAIRALHALMGKMEEKVYLVICGGSESNPSPEETSYLAELKELAHSLEISDRVIFHPAVPHRSVNIMYSAADVMMMVSENEPFGLTVLESMSVGLPVVASNTGGPSNLIVHNETGCLVNIHYPQRMANYIFALLKDEEYYLKIAENGYRFVHSEFDWGQRAKEFHGVYQEVLKSERNVEFDDWIKQNYFLAQNF